MVIIIIIIITINIIIIIISNSISSVISLINNISISIVISANFIFKANNLSITKHNYCRKVLIRRLGYSHNVVTGHSNEKTLARNVMIFVLIFILNPQGQCNVPVVTAEPWISILSPQINLFCVTLARHLLLLLVRTGINLGWLIQVRPHCFVQNISEYWHFY